MRNKNLESRYIPFQCLILSRVNRFSVEGVTTAQYTILDILDKQGDKTTKELTELRGISQAGMSKLTKRLLDKGYIRQSRRETDRRVYDLSLTPEGREFLARSERFRHTMLDLIESRLTAEEAEQFAALCEKISAAGDEE
ncbi:MarR family winged helix-turn-helix transcriptional regulator [Saccharibacillus alkalitolerans]|uniref:MarR family transcriptional regulator n=1 Tax=Saccharibacillus alkalitolerans TaxID=2705290 RepID=A0ABX0F702_9BACL|nr:MarR family transcriptional regulator [Saccharibacillus alkalitolerans]NGZ75314.1 MarR family transcriptional regulator [Saccharibacillus alkalitolerans]